ncbi:hypothetical protein CEXT_441441 [Caerostris extrusa]|uniref:Uncharacterized protein n=1 Tax=Caerostris extrusa TaxID=172846 RepID=A0AAV4PHY3_CAEEX|nr:hypothetical protein CEXT_441441 [Caerostris extrusa]
MTVERQTKPHLAQDQSENLTVQNLQSATTLEQVAKHDVERQTKQKRLSITNLPSLLNNEGGLLLRDPTIPFSA